MQLRSGPEPPAAEGGPGPDPAAHTLIVEPDDGPSSVLDAIADATASIELTIYELSDPAIVQALAAAQGRKVAVRVLYDWYSFSPDDQQQKIMPFIDQLQTAGVSCRPAPRVFEVTHEKAMVIDGGSALVLTFNLASEYFSTTRDFGIVTRVPAEVTEIAAVFEADWNDLPITPTEASLVWSPVNSRARLAALIGVATATLEIYCEEALDPGTLGALVAAAKRGVRVRLIAAVLDSPGTANGNAAGITYLNSGGVTAVSKSFRVSTRDGPKPIYIHAKVILADVGTSAGRAFLGSENLSCVSLDDNRECGILIDEPEILARIEATFNADWDQPSTPVAADPSPLTACPGDAAGRTDARVIARS